jgi:hypothetical protein
METAHAYLVVAAGLAVSLGAWWLALRLYLAQRRWPVRMDGRWIIAAHTPQSALVEALGMTASNCRVGRRGPRGLVMHLGGCSAAVSFSPCGQGSEMHALLDWARGARMFGFLVGLLVLVVQPAVIIGLGGGLWHWVASSDSAEVRILVLQVVQIGHVLWPPFLVHLIYRRLRRNSRRVVEQLAELLAKPTPAAGSAAVVS